MRFFIKTLGCRTNISESESLSNALAEKGHSYSEHEPDLIVINSCTVTAKADRKTRQALHVLQHKFPKAKCVVIGCGVRNTELTWPVESYATYEDFLETIKPSKKAENFELSLKVRAHIKIQEGCNNSCSYCIIPLVRGLERSVPLQSVLAEVKGHLARGVQEIVLTGTHIANWGKDFDDKKDLKFLVEKILKETDVPLLRLSSLEAQDFGQELAEIFKNKRVCPYVHIALQSGSDGILAVMERHYLSADVAKLIKSLRAVRPEIFIGADVIVAFPGETERQFQETYDFCRDMRFSKLHVFPYSERPGTKAANLNNKLTKDVRQERVAKLRELSAELLSSYTKSFIGSEIQVLLEGVKDGFTRGTSSNFLKATISGERQDLIGKTVNLSSKSWEFGSETLRCELAD